MKKIFASALFLSLGLSSPEAALAELYTLDSRIGTESLNIAASTPGAANKIRVPLSFLGKNHLFYLSITATSEASLDLGIMSDVTYVKQVVGSDSVKFVLAAPIVGDPNATVGAEVHSMKANVQGDAAELDLSGEIGFRTEGGKYHADGPKETRDVVQKADRLEYTQIYELKNVEPKSEDAPPTITLGIRVYLLERENTAYQPRTYPAADRSKIGFFALSTFQGIFNNFPANDYMMRWDLNRPITYTLHPSVPAEYRERVTKAILAWNPVFQKTTGKSPIKVIQGTDPNLLPGNPDTSVVYWFSGDVPKMYLGQARPVTDPRTGEIITSYLLFSQSEVDGALQLRRIEAAIDKASSQQAQPAVLSFGAGRGFRLNPRSEGIFHAEGEDMDRLLGDSADPNEVLKKLLDNTVSHELGHSLGLRHNFSASADLTNLVGNVNATSVMDYVPTMRSPGIPQGYDYKAIAYGYQGQVPSEFNKNYFYGSDEHEPGLADANRFDEGEPYTYHTDQMRKLRRARARLEILQRPQVYQALMGRATGVLPKFLVNKNDPRFAKAFEFHTKMLTFKGPAVTGGGTGGVPSQEVAPEVGFQKNVFERATLMLAVAQRGRAVELDAQVATQLAKLLEDTLVDEEKSDVFIARLVAIPALVGLREPGLRALVSGTRRIAAAAQAHQNGPTFQQEVALLKIIKQLFDQARGGAAPQAVRQIAPNAISAFEGLDLGKVPAELNASLAD